MTPDYKYPSRPMHLKGADDDDLGLGLTVEETPPNPNGWSGVDKRIHFVDVRTVDLTGFGEVGVEIDVPIFTFLNGLVLCFQSHNDGNGIRSRFVFKYEGEVVSDQGWGWKPMALNVPRTGWGDLSNCKFHASTYYFRPTADVTSAFGLYFNILVPAYRQVSVSATELATAKADLHQAQDGRSAWLATDIMWAESDTSLPGVADHYRVGIATWEYPNSNPGLEFYIQNLSAFNTYMKTAGRGTGGKDIYDNDEDPAGTDDPSGPGGGGGNYDDTSDPIDFPDLPTGGALESGAVVAHRVSKQTLEAIMSKLWDNSIFNITGSWQKSIQDPMDAIVSLHALPFSPTVNGPTNIWIGNFDTELTSPLVTSQYVTIDCGTLDISEYWGSALDYSPYTRAEIYLPFCGVKDVSIEDIMRSTLHVKYNVDVLTGDCIAFVKCGQSVLYHFEGNCKMQIPLTSKSTDALTNAGLGIGAIVSAGGAVATGGSSLLVAGATISAASSVAGSKIRTGRGSDLSGSIGLLDDFVPYIILHRPVQSLAKDYNKFKGYPSNITATLGSLTGYTEVEHVHIRNIPNATSAEMEEIKNLLKTGVLL